MNLSKFNEWLLELIIKIRIMKDYDIIKRMLFIFWLMCKIN